MTTPGQPATRRPWTAATAAAGALAGILTAAVVLSPPAETDITLVCVSNQVGGTYKGNARWLGAPPATLLRRAGVRAGADQVLSTAADGMTISTPVEAIMDGRGALLAVRAASVRLSVTLG